MVASSTRMESVAARGGDRIGAGYARFIAALATSFYGDWFTTVALLVAVYGLSSGPVAPALLALVRLGPRLVASPLGGRLADGMNPAVLAATASAVQAGAALGLVAAVGARSLPVIYLLVAASSTLGAVARPAHMPIITSLVPAELRPRANALYGSTFSLSLAVAPALAAVAVAATGPILLLVLDAASFLVAAAVLVSLPVRRTERDLARAARAPRRPIAREALGDPFLRMVAAGAFAGGLCAAAAQAVLVVGAADRFGGEGHVGLLYAAVGAGAAAGTMLSVRLQPARVSRVTVCAWALLEVAGLALVGVAPSLALAAAALTVNGAAAGLYQTWASTEVQRRVAPEQLGRISGVTLSALYLGWMLGAGLGIALGGHMRWDHILLVACGVGATALLAASAGRGAGRP